MEWALHGFMVFITVNGTIVFESGVIRWASVAGLVVIDGVWVKRSPAGQELGEKTAE